jgi:hypothetical protein
MRFSLLRNSTHRFGKNQRLLFWISENSAEAEQCDCLNAERAAVAGLSQARGDGRQRR